MTNGPEYHPRHTQEWLRMCREDDCRQAHDKQTDLTCQSLRLLQYFCVTSAFMRQAWVSASWMTSKLGDGWLGGWPSFCECTPADIACFCLRRSRSNEETTRCLEVSSFWFLIASFQASDGQGQPQDALPGPCFPPQRGTLYGVLTFGLGLKRICGCKARAEGSLWCGVSQSRQYNLG